MALLLLGTVAALLVRPEVALAQGMEHVGRLPVGQIAAGISSAAAQGLVVGLVGLAAFSTVVWLPASRPRSGVGEAGRPFVRVAWMLA